jgi:hypothetical protein
MARKRFGTFVLVRAGKAKSVSNATFHLHYQAIFNHTTLAFPWTYTLFQRFISSSCSDKRSRASRAPSLIMRPPRSVS